MPPYFDYLLQTLDDLARALDGPVRTVVLADTLGLPPRSTRRYVAQLERAGRVGRLTPKSGWLPVWMQRTRDRRAEPDGRPRQLCLPGFEMVLWGV